MNFQSINWSSVGANFLKLNDSPIKSWPPVLNASHALVQQKIVCAFKKFKLVLILKTEGQILFSKIKHGNHSKYSWILFKPADTVYKLFEVGYTINLTQKVNSKGAWKRNFPSFQEIMTYRSTNRTSDQRQTGLYGRYELAF